MSDMLTLFSNSTINTDSIITPVTRAKSCIARHYQIRFTVRSVLNTLFDLSNKLLNAIFEIVCTENRKAIYISDSVIQIKDQEQFTKNKYYCKAHLKNIAI